MYPFHLGLSDHPCVGLFDKLGLSDNYEYSGMRLKVSPLTIPSTKPDTMLTIKLFRMPKQKFQTVKEFPYVR